MPTHAHDLIGLAPSVQTSLVGKHSEWLGGTYGTNASRNAINAPIGAVCATRLLNRQGSGETHSEDALYFLMRKYAYFQFQATAQKYIFQVQNHSEHMSEVSI